MQEPLAHHISSYDYHLPKELIAQQPIEKRDQSRLLVYNRSGKTITHKVFSHLPSLLKAGDVLVLNNTRVFRNRLFGTRAKTGGKIEVFLLEPPCTSVVRAITKSGGKLCDGEIISFADRHIECKILSSDELGERLLEFNISSTELSSFLRSSADVPLPPYISRPEGSTRLDESRYQTVYAERDGAVAAPTAGFHFTPQLLDQLAGMGVKKVFVTLHVGRGTFEPVRTNDISQHVMHSESYELTDESAKAINLARENGSRVIAVGTTSVRVLESAADSDGRLCTRSGSTDIFIYPPYKFKVCDALLTNFHLPKSTLLMLVSAFAGRDEILRAYSEAVKLRYRFFSYGDAMFLY